MTIYKGNITIIICSALLLQLFLVGWTFPITELFSQKPLFYIDNAFHWYYLKLINNIIENGTLTGYDPYFSAGSLGGITSDVSGHAGQAVTFILKKYVTEIQAWKIYVFFTAIIGPILPSISLIIFKFSPMQIIIGTGLSIIIWWTSWFHWFHVAGMASYVVATFFSLLIIAKFIHQDPTTTLSNTIRMSVLVAILVFIHPLAILPIFTLLTCFLCFNYFEIRNNQIVWVVTSVLMGITLNLFWLVPFLFTGSGATMFNIVSYQAEVKPINIILELMGIWKDHIHGSKVYPLLFLLSGIAIFRNESNIKQVYIWPFILAWLILEIYAWTAGAIPIFARLTQPNRFAPAGYLLLIVPATLAFRSLEWKTLNLFKPRTAFLTGTYISAGLLAAININEILREISYGKHGHYAAPPPQVKDFGPYTDFVLDTLAKETNTSARVLFETSLGRVHDQGHLAGYYAYTSNREFIGGPYPYTYFSGFWDGFVFGKPIKEIPQEKFMEYLKSYNIGWIIAHSPASKAYFNNLPTITKGTSFNELQLYIVNQTHSFFLNGNGIIDSRKHNIIHLKELSGDIVDLKYHYYKDLVTNTGDRIEYIFLMDDPTPFIRFKKPPKEIIIRIP
jgi:hypothetical protein